MKILLNEKEEIVTKNTVSQCFPFRIWLFFKTNQGREFTCMVSNEKEKIIINSLQHAILLQMGSLTFLSNFVEIFFLTI